MRVLDGLTRVDWAIPTQCELAAVVAKVGDHRATLPPAESALVAGAAAARAKAFSSGRRAAREALAAFGVYGHPLTRRGRAPAWPEGLVGSLAHSRALVFAVVGRRDRYAGVGADVELAGRVTNRAANRVLTAGERQALRGAAWRTGLFSAKEAVYKAVNPVTGEYLAFTDVHIDVAPDAPCRFRAKTTRPAAAAELVASGQGLCRARTRVAKRVLAFGSLCGAQMGVAKHVLAFSSLCRA